MLLLHALATGHKVSRRGQLLRATQLPPTCYSLSNVRADLGVGSNCSMGKGLGAAGGVVAREDHSGYDDGQGQPQPQQHHADCGPAALSHGSAAQEKGRQVGRQASGQTNAQPAVQMDRQDGSQMNSQMIGQMDKQMGARDRRMD